MSEPESSATKWIGLASAVGVVVLLILFLSGRSRLEEANGKLDDLRASLKDSQASGDSLRKELDRLAQEIKDLKEKDKEIQESCRKTAERLSVPVSPCKACQEQVPQLQKKLEELEQRATLLYEALRKLKSSER